MIDVPKEDRLAFWAYTSAAATFHVAKKSLDNVHPKKTDQDPDIRYAFMCSFVVFYGRAFKQKKSVKHVEALIPTEHKDLHAHLLVLRDKAFAHLDPDELVVGTGMANRSQITVRGGGFSAALNYFTFSEPHRQQAKQLLQVLEKKCRYHAVKIWKKYSKKNPIPDGIYQINLDENPVPLLEEWKSFNSSGPF